MVLHIHRSRGFFVRVSLWGSGNFLTQHTQKMHTSYTSCTEPRSTSESNASVVVSASLSSTTLSSSSSSSTSSSEDNSSSMMSSASWMPSSIDSSICGWIDEAQLQISVHVYELWMHHVSHRGSQVYGQYPYTLLIYVAYILTMYIQVRFMPTSDYLLFLWSCYRCIPIKSVYGIMA